MCLAAICLAAMCVAAICLAAVSGNVGNKCMHTKAVDYPVTTSHLRLKWFINELEKVWFVSENDIILYCFVACGIYSMFHLRRFCAHLLVLLLCDCVVNNHEEFYVDLCYKLWRTFHSQNSSDVLSSTLCVYQLLNEWCQYTSLYYQCFVAIGWMSYVWSGSSNPCILPKKTKPINRTIE